MHRSSSSRLVEDVSPPGALAYYPPLLAHSSSGSHPCGTSSPPPSQQPPSADAGGRRGNAAFPPTAPESRATASAPLATEGGAGPFDDVSAEGFLSFKAEVPYLKACSLSPPRVIFQPPSILQLCNAAGVDAQGLHLYSGHRLPSISLCVEMGEFAFNYQDMNNDLREEDRVDKLCPPDPLDWDSVAFEVQRRSQDSEEALWEERFWCDMKRARQEEKERRELKAQQKAQYQQRRALARASVSSVGGSRAALSAQLTPLSRQQSLKSFFGGRASPMDPALPASHNTNDHRRPSGGLLAAREQPELSAARAPPTLPPTSAQQTAKGFLRRAKYNEGRHVAASAGQTLPPSATVRAAVPTVTRSSITSAATASGGGGGGGGFAENGFRFPVLSIRSEASNCVVDLSSTVGSGSNLPSVLADVMTPLTPQTVDGGNTPRAPGRHSAGVVYDSSSNTAARNVNLRGRAGAEPFPPTPICPERRPANTATGAAASPAAAKGDGSHSLVSGRAAATATTETDGKPSGSDALSSADAMNSKAPRNARADNSVSSRAAASSSRDPNTALPEPASPRASGPSNLSMTSQSGAGNPARVTVVVAPEPMPAESGRQRRPPGGAPNVPSASRAESLHPTTTTTTNGNGNGQQLQYPQKQGRADREPARTLKQPPAHLNKSPCRVSPDSTHVSGAAARPPDAGDLAQHPSTGSPSVNTADGVLPHLPQKPQPAPNSRVRVPPMKGSPLTHRRDSAMTPTVAVSGGGCFSFAVTTSTFTSSPDGGLSPDATNNTLTTAGVGSSFLGATEDSAKDQSFPMADSGVHGGCGGSSVVVVRQHEVITPGRTPRKAKGEENLTVERDRAYGGADHRSHPPPSEHHHGPLRQAPADGHQRAARATPYASAKRQAATENGESRGQADTAAAVPRHSQSKAPAPSGVAADSLSPRRATAGSDPQGARSAGRGTNPWLPPLSSPSNHQNGDATAAEPSPSSSPVATGDGGGGGGGGAPLPLTGSMHASSFREPYQQHPEDFGTGDVSHCHHAEQRRPLQAAGAGPHEPIGASTSSKGKTAQQTRQRKTAKKGGAQCCAIM